MSHSRTRLSLRAGAASVVLAVALAAGAVPASAKVLAKVNGVEITDEDLAIARADLEERMPRELQGPARDKALLDNLIVAKVVAQKAEADKLAATPEFTRRLAYFRDKLLTETYLGKLAEAANTDANIQKTYDEVAKSQKPEPEVHARHILVPTEDEAKKALERVKGGEDFAKVAGEVSKDPGSKGGDLGWFTKDRMVPEFAEAAFKLEKPGEHFRAREEPVRLACHQARRQADEGIPQARAGPRPGGPLCHAEGGGRRGRQAARRRQDRTFRRAAEGHEARRRGSRQPEEVIRTATAHAPAEELPERQRQPRRMRRGPFV